MIPEVLAPEETLTLDAEETLTFDVEDLLEPEVVIVGSIPENLADPTMQCNSNSSCYTATCTWAECCNPPCTPDPM